MIALLLAQLVMPSPSVEPLSPPGMICMGECDGGPMVWRASPARGRLVVACDMRSDTCSDGRKITTARASPVPCEVSPGVWEMVPEDTACISWRGLESWTQNTSYLSWGAELDRGPWVGAAVPASQGYQITGPLSQSMAAVGVAEQRTTAWILRADTPRLVTIGVQPTGGCEVEVGTEWRTYSCTEQVAIGVSPEARITQPVGQSVYGIAAWHTRSATPGRPCWGGEAPVTCDADRHTISTEGWPTEAGEVCITAALETMSSWNSLFRDPVPPNIRLEARLNGLELNGLSPANLQLSYSPPLELSRTYTYCAGRRKDGKAWLGRDGTFLGESEVDPFTWSSAVDLGRTSHWSGSISSLRVRSFE